MINPIVSYGMEEITVTRDLAQFLRGWVTGFITGVSLVEVTGDSGPCFYCGPTTVAAQKYNAVISGRRVCPAHVDCYYRLSDESDGYVLNLAAVVDDLVSATVDYFVDPSPSNARVVRILKAVIIAAAQEV